MTFKDGRTCWELEVKGWNFPHKFNWLQKFVSLPLHLSLCNRTFITFPCKAQRHVVDRKLAKGRLQKKTCQHDSWKRCQGAEDNVCTMHHAGTRSLAKGWKKGRSFKLREKVVLSVTVDNSFWKTGDWYEDEDVKTKALTGQSHVGKSFWGFLCRGNLIKQIHSLCLEHGPNLYWFNAPQTHYFRHSFRCTQQCPQALCK